MDKLSDIFLYNDQDIQSILAVQRRNIKNDTDQMIEEFLRNENALTARKLYLALKTMGPPQNAFETWKHYIETKDEVTLKSYLRKQEIPFWDYVALGSLCMAEDDSVRTNNIGSLAGEFARSTLVSAGSLFVVPFVAPKFKGDMNFQQQITFFVLQSIHELYDGPTVMFNPLLNVLAPYIKEAVQENLTVSFKKLEKNSWRKLLDESLVHSKRDEIIAKSYEIFDRISNGLVTVPSAAEIQRLPEGLKSAQIPSDAKFGFELEGFIPAATSFFENVRQVGKTLKAVELEPSHDYLPKTNCDYNKWSIVFDYTINDPLKYTEKTDLKKRMDSLGLEVVSPVLNGNKGGLHAKRAIISLKDIFMTNASCGMHVHISLEGKSLEELKNLAKALKKNEDRFDDLIHPERRGSNNDFCHRLPAISDDQIDTATSVQELVGLINPNFNRNHKFDFTGLVLDDAPNTLQFRGEGGPHYMNNAFGHIVVLTNFIEQAGQNPDIDLEDLLQNLDADKNNHKQDRLPGKKGFFSRLLHLPTRPGPEI